MSEKQRYTAPRTDIEQSQGGPVKIRLVESDNKDGFLELWLDYEKAETPARAYFADYVSVGKGRADVTLVFGRLIAGGSNLRSQIEISFPTDSFVSQLWKSTRGVHAWLKDPTHVRPLEPLGPVKPSEMVHTSRANNVFVALMGEEAICDFYYIAPSELQFVRMGRRHTVSLEPIIRISLPAPLVLEFLDRCEQVISQIPEAESILKRGEEARQ
jgi:hypothetical protein